MESRPDHAGFAQLCNRTEVVVLEGVPKIENLVPKQTEPGAGVGCDVRFRFGRPERRDFGTPERTARLGFS
jgi:hypothetical protein